MDRRLLQRLPTIDDCRRRSRRRLPRFLFDFIDGGTEREEALFRNRRAFSDVLLPTRVGRSVEHPETGVTLFGQRWKLPFGVSPCGYIDLIEPGTEIATAAAAEARGAPFILSMSSISSLEECIAAAPGSAWLQVVQSRDPAIVEDILGRADTSGFRVLVVTMDVPMSSKRNRDLRNGFTLPLAITPSLIWDVATSPAWLLGTLRRLRPLPGNFLAYVPPGVSPTEAAMRLEHEADYVTRWEDLSTFRSRWPGTLVVKGITHPDDAERALDLGADGIIVSNHGGRQFDAARPTISSLPAVVERVAGRAPVMLDSGVRSGLDIMRALSLGASMVFSGRSFYYAAGALGRRGGAHAFDLLEAELTIAMRQRGVSTVEELLPEPFE